MRRLVSLYVPSYARTLVYMLQNTEYQIRPYLAWYRRIKDFDTVMYRRKLVPTTAARSLLAALSIAMLLQVCVGTWFIWQGYTSNNFTYTTVGTLLVVVYPFVWAYAVVVPLWLGRVCIIDPRNRRLIARSEKIFASHPGLKIAVAGSYGKTSMKELLKIVLSEGKRVAATPANKNVPVSHALFASKLKGHEDILIIEFGESAPGDVERFARITQPKLGVITGVAPAHLDHYPSLEAAAQDIFSLGKYVGFNNTYVNGDSVAAKPFIEGGMHIYDGAGALGWKVSDIKVDFKGTEFTIQKGKQQIIVKSGLLGKHQVGPLALVVALAHQLGLNKKQIEAGVAKTQAFEHRMQARHIRGAWLLDDTYNGNIDGMRAGLALLKELPAKRKIYVTPGLVDQGVETEAVHRTLGQAIAQAAPDKVILMKNSVTKHIQRGLQADNYKGKLVIETEPLNFYTNIEHFIAAGDVIMMQNDWTDNYN